jgi:hypothetical protein
VGKWQPIATAPKDGRAILIFDPERPESEEWRGHKFDDHRFSVGYWRTWAPHGGWGNRNNATVEPTHWMPLPEPPSISDQGDGAWERETALMEDTGRCSHGVATEDVCAPCASPALPSEDERC